MHSLKRMAQRLGDAVRNPFILWWRILVMRSLAPLRDREAIGIIDGSGLFDRRWYLERNPDVAASGIDPIEHYVRHGAREGRDPSPSFSTHNYLIRNSDLATAGINPLAHFVLLQRPGKGLYGKISKLPGHLADRFRQGVYVFARAIYRAMPIRDTPVKIRLRYGFLRYFSLFLPEGSVGFVAPSVIVTRSGPNLKSLSDLNRSSLLSDPAAYFLAPTEEPLHDDGYSVARFMYYVWRLRPDLMRAFNLYDRESRLEFCKWFLLNAPHEYAVPDHVYPDDLLIKLAGTKGSAAARARTILDERNKLGLGPAPNLDDTGTKSELVHDLHDDGANLIGYCRGEFGMGGVVRSMARAFDAVHTPFSMIDYQKTGTHGYADNSSRHWITNIKKYRTNIFCINADAFPFLYFDLGRLYIPNCYNIGYWAWELSKCPMEFELALAMVDEVWAISDFTATSFQTRSTVPVINMPLAVSLPVLRRQYSKSYFGLPDNCFQFMFTFDAESYIDRKNPIAVVRAFRLAFPRGDEKVHLLLKTMNTRSEDPFWGELIAEAKMDPRIAIIDKRLERDQVLGLNSVCDAFVSLHRSEGFGFNLAEAMLMGKPVIATNYSGSREFAREGTACVVNYRLVPVPEGSYPFSQGQVWAEPDIEHAAELMRRLANDNSYREKIARSGQRFIIDNFNEAKIGARYATRLEDIKSKANSICAGSTIAGGGDCATFIGLRRRDCRIYRSAGA